VLTRVRRPHDRGSVLFAMPAAFLVILILGAIAADLSHVHNTKRELINVANSIANDAVTYGVDKDEARRHPGTYPLTDRRVRQAIDTALAAHQDTDRRYDLVTYDFDATERVVHVKLHARVDYFFAKAIPGTPKFQDLTANGTAFADED
jgi:hypothetical protein